MRVLPTGMSRAGKSTLVRELRRHGQAAYDAADDGLIEPRGDGRWAGARIWWSRRHADGLLWIRGCSEERIEAAVECRVLLTAPEAVLVNRSRSRTGDAYGRGESERAQVLADLAEVGPLLRRSAHLVLTTTAPAAAARPAPARPPGRARRGVAAVPRAVAFWYPAS